MRKKTIAMIGVPMVLVAIAIALVLPVPVMYYGNMLLVIVLHIKPTEQQIIGRYEAKSDVGNASLVVNGDHTFSETVQPLNGAPQVVNGSWKPSHINDSVGFETQFFPYVGVLHDKFQSYAYGTPVFEKNVIGQVSIEEDPDWGISFHKQKKR